MIETFGQIEGISKAIAAAIGAIMIIPQFKDFISSSIFGKITWNQTLKVIKKIIKNMESDNYEPEIIICGGRGGSILGSLISWNHTKNLIPIELVDFNYTKKDQKTNINIRNSINEEHIRNKKVLICVGVMQTGDTIDKLFEYIENLKPREIKTACIFATQDKPIRTVDYKGKHIKNKKKFAWHYQNLDISK